MFRTKYFEERKKEIKTIRLINNLTDFCINLIKEIAKGDVNKEQELIEKMIKSAISYHSYQESEVEDE